MTAHTDDVPQPALKPPAVLIADDHAAIRQGLRMILDGSARVVGEAADGASAVHMARSLECDVVLMDIRMPGLDGIEATRRIAAEGRASVLILSTFGLDDYVLSALRAGAAGYLLKSVSASELTEAVRRVAAGQTVLAPEVTRAVVDQALEARSPGAEPPEALAELTPREVEVLQAVGAGWSNQQIARKLGIAEVTVKSHISRIFSKLGLASRVQAAIFCAQHLPH
ncbi:response regulator transcription factor [Acaricomes phytoseiuli]|uniref:response regulator n=1 Tax=Acaricomes phytoseiuli TaxID=291968 RepID=UPI000378EA93|nr:response regulator transcription factor [Acaricomes phytoseiuli]MCW1248967.1 response regulator transcription factor [Acaricomes phytoseiuli]